MKGNLMKLFSKEQHQAILNRFPSDRRAAIAYNELAGRRVAYRQLVRYWRMIFLEHNGSVAVTNRELIRQRVLRVPQPDDDVGDLNHIPEIANVIMVIPDIHAPYNHPDAMDFLKLIRDTYRPDLVVNLGDELDKHAMSFHDSDPNLDSAGMELLKGRKVMDQLHELFPNMLLCHSNHGSMHYRKAKAHGIPVEYLKSYRDVIFPKHGAPGWSWGFEWTIQTPSGDLLFKHQKAGPGLGDASHNRSNLIVGHEHSLFNIEYGASSSSLYFAAVAGCLVDRSALAFAYGKNIAKKPIIGAMVVVRGEPLLIPMPLDYDGRWTRAPLAFQPNL